MSPLSTSIRTDTAADDLLERLFTSDAGRADPYPLYRELRERAPVHRSGLDGVWYLSRYQDCMATLLNPRCGRKPLGQPGSRVFFVERDRAFRFTQRVRDNMLWANPPEHTRLRGPANPAFAPRRMESLRARITEVVDGLLDDLVAAGRADAMETLAFRLPVLIIGDLLGVPERDRTRFRGLADDPFTNDSADGAEWALAAYLAELLAERRQSPTDDVLSLLVSAPGGIARLSEPEQVSAAAILFWAGYATTANLVGNGLNTLFAHPAAWARLVDDPALVPGAVEEFLRFDSPVQLNGRYVLDDIDVGGVHIGGGQSVMTMIGGANHDPDRFCDPERFDVARADNAPLSFGWGIHHCLGAPLARLEAQIVFTRLAERRLHLEPAGQAERAEGIFVRGLATLPVRVKA